MLNFIRAFTVPASILFFGMALIYGGATAVGAQLPTELLVFMALAGGFAVVMLLLSVAVWMGDRIIADERAFRRNPSVMDRRIEAEVSRVNMSRFA